MAKTIVIQTPPTGVNKGGRVDFKKSRFDALVYEKGYRVIHEKALKCPCVSPSTNQQTSCKNCGGTGWVFINPIDTRMVLHSMNLDTKFKQWSEENRGTASVSALAESEIGFMDRISVIDGIAIWSETLFLKEHDTLFYWDTIYDIKEISYIALFEGTDKELRPLKYQQDFIYTENKITLLDHSLIKRNEENKLDTSIVVRYKHNPQLHIIDVPRETIQTFINISGVGEEPVSLPVHAIARRNHYVLDRQNIDNTRVLDNTNHNLTYDYFNPPKKDC